MESLSQQKKVKKFKIRMVICLLILAVTLPFTILKAMGYDVPTVKQAAYYFGLSDDADNNAVEVWFLSVGQGDCSIIRVEDTTIMIDCGTPNSYDEIKYFLNVKNISNIDYMILSHLHSDHIGSAGKIIDKFKVKEIFLPDMVPSDENDKKICDQMFVAADIKGTRMTTVFNGFSFSFEKLKFDFYCDNIVSNDENDNSLVTMVSVNGRRILYTADIGFAFECQLVSDKIDIDTDLLKVAHHGSKNSTSKKFVEYATPEYSVISVGKNTYGHPTDTVIQTLLDAGSIIYRTDISTVGFSISDSGEIIVL